MVRMSMLWVALFLGFALVGGAPAARPPAVGCGQTITANTKLGADLLNCPANGIVIGADNITLDLNGHVVDGDGLGSDAGIDNGAGHDGVTIKGGSVREFFDGVRIVGGSQNRMRELKATSNGHVGVNLADCTDSQVESNFASGSLVGIATTACHNIRIEGNSVSRNREGIVLIVCDGVRIVRNSATDNPDNGIGLNGGERNVIEKNFLTGNGNGIFIAFGSDHNVVSENTAVGNTIGGVDIETDHNVATKNVLHSNALVGLVIVAGDDNRVEQNSVDGNGDGSEGGIHVLSLEDNTSDGNTISRNSLTGNVGDGILVEADVNGSAIEGNAANKNTDDGIDVESAATTLTRNTANRNNDLGIEAIPGIHDGGGNKASNNGNPAQCTNVACR